MIIKKIFNNNAVAVVHEGKEFIVTGSGIGFQKKIGDEIDQSKIERTYAYEYENQTQLYQLLSSIPIEHFEVSKQIVEEAANNINIVYKDKTIIALTDHISFAIERQKNGVNLPNIILPDVRSLYPMEYNYGLYGLDIIKKELGITLNPDEASYITLHLLNGSLNQSPTKTLDTINLVNDALKLIRSYFKLDPEFSSIELMRLTTHLKFLAHRIFNEHLVDKMDYDNDMFNYLKGKDAEVYQCVLEVKDMIDKNFNYQLGQQELVYLMIHLYRIIHK